MRTFIRSLFFLLCSATATGVGAQVTQVSSSLVEGTYTNPVLNHVPGPGADRCLIFIAGNEYDLAGNDVVSVAYGGIPMTVVGTIDIYTFNCWAEIEVWALLEADITAAIGTAFTVTYATGSWLRAIKHSAITYSGVDQATPFGAIETSSNSGSASVTCADLPGNINDMLISAVSGGNDGSYAFTPDFNPVFNESGGTHTYSASERQFILPCPVGPTATYTAVQNRQSMISLVVKSIAPGSIDILPAAANICAGDILVLDATTAGATYTWQDGSTAATFDVTVAGTYTVDVDIAGCIITESIDVTVTDVPLVLNDATICAGDVHLFDVTTAGATYIWQDGSTGATFNATTAGVYTVDVTVAGCTSSESATIDVIDFAVILNDAIICDGVEPVLDATTAGATYVWQDGSTGATFTVTSTGTYTVDVTVAGCTETESADVTLSNIVVNLDDAQICDGQTILLDATFPGATYVWNDGSTLPSLLVSEEGTYTVTLTVDGCTETESAVITTPEIDASFLFHANNPNDPYEVTFANSSDGATSYTWYFGDSYSSNEENPVHSYGQAGQYTVTLIAYNGLCSDIAEQIVVLFEDVVFYIPNSFTPDGNEYNETFRPVFYSGVDPYDFHMIIFNRWGERVFESFNAAAGWDGTYSDQGLTQEGVYIWRIEFGDLKSDERHIAEGHVSVMK